MLPWQLSITTPSLPPAISMSDAPGKRTPLSSTLRMRQKTTAQQRYKQLNETSNKKYAARTTT